MEYECSICCDRDNRPLYQLCKCKNLVHEECINRVVTLVKSHRERCPICQQPYKFETLRTSRHVVDKSCTCLFVLGCFGIMLPFWTNIFMCKEDTHICAAFHGALTAITALTFISFLYIWISYYQARGTLCPCFYVLEEHPKLCMPAEACV